MSRLPEEVRQEALNLAEAEGMKFLINAPCATVIGHRVKSAPTVDCEWDCSNCGWNPKEKERRLKEGTFIKGTLHFKRRFFDCGIGSAENGD